MLFRRELVMFGPREVLLTSEEPVVSQFLNGRRAGPIGMSEEKDQATLALERTLPSEVDPPAPMVAPLAPSPGLPERQAARRRKDRVMSMLPTLPLPAQRAIVDSLTPEDHTRYLTAGRP
jgi:phospholipid/cholesterol/gamma-HCH transport system ATP-binding protein